MQKNRKDRKFDIYLSAPQASGKEIKYLKEAVSQHQLSLFGNQCDMFASKLQEQIGVKHTLLLNSGTSAIQLALLALDVGQQDVVLCSDFTYVASANPILYQGATPVFIDSEPGTWNMDPNILEDSLQRINASSHQRPKAIIPVHLYGMPADMAAINAIAQRYEIPVIEDAAEALGSTYDGRPCGALGDLGVLSFNGNKIITTSGGGALLSDNEAYIQKAKYLATQARDDTPHYQHSQVGYNYRMGNINAAIGLGQMEVLDERIKRKREIWQFYYQELKDLFEFQFPEESSPPSRISGSPHPRLHANRWLTTILTKSYEQRERIRLALEKENIESRPLWKPMHLQPVFREALFYGGTVAEEMFNRGLCLPSGTAMTEGDLERVVEIIRRTFNRKER